MMTMYNVYEENSGLVSGVILGLGNSCNSRSPTYTLGSAIISSFYVFCTSTAFNLCRLLISSVLWASVNSFLLPVSAGGWARGPCVVPTRAVFTVAAQARLIGHAPRTWTVP